MEASGSSKGAFYHYFPNKQSIFLANVLLLGAAALGPEFERSRLGIHRGGKRFDDRGRFAGQGTGVMSGVRLFREAAIAQDWNKAIIEEFRGNGGKVGGPFAGAPLLILHSVGAKSGKPRTNPLMYLDLGHQQVAVFASKGGAPANPDWYHNLMANPRATVELGNETFDVTARVARGEERLRIWNTQKQNYPSFAEYERKTKREIPVVILERARR